ncbi:MAG: EamA family transporter [Lentisphaeria bacterium]|nr:EamA family transporter [Lentisphaeria bacterium]
MELLRGISYMIIVGLCWTSFGIVMGRAPRKNVDVGVMLFFSSLVAITACTALGAAEGFPRQCPPKEFWITFGALFVCGILNFVQLDLMSRAMKTGPNGIVWSLIQTSFIFPFVAGVLFFHARCTWFNLIGALSIIAALIILGMQKGNASGKGTWKLFAFLSFLSTGIAQLLSNLPSYFPEAASVSSIWRSAFFAMGLAAGTVGGTLILQRKHLKEAMGANIRNSSMWIYCFVLQGFEILASIFLLYPGMNLLADAGAGAIAYPLVVASGIAGFEFYAFTFLREKRNVPQMIAFVLTLLGIAALCF